MNDLSLEEWKYTRPNQAIFFHFVAKEIAFLKIIC